MTPADFELLVKDYRLTTAEIFYCFPDHPSLLQTFVWQELDLAPKFPELNKFLGFWEDSIDGRLHSVQVTSAETISPAQFAWRSGSLQLQ